MVFCLNARKSQGVSGVKMKNTGKINVRSLKIKSLLDVVLSICVLHKREKNVEIKGVKLGSITMDETHLSRIRECSICVLRAINIVTLN